MIPSHLLGSSHLLNLVSSCLTPGVPDQSHQRLDIVLIEKNLYALFEVVYTVTNDDMERVFLLFLHDFLHLLRIYRLLELIITTAYIEIDVG